MARPNLRQRMGRYFMWFVRQFASMRFARFESGSGFFRARYERQVSK